MKSGVAKLIDFFENKYKAAKALKISYATIYNWEKTGKVKPELALRCEKLTGGKVKRFELNEKAYPPNQYKKLWPHIKKINKYI